MRAETLCIKNSRTETLFISNNTRGDASYSSKNARADALYIPKKHARRRSYNANKTKARGDATNLNKGRAQTLLSQTKTNARDNMTRRAATL